MSCDAVRPQRRTLLGWLMLVVLAGLAAFYGYVLWLAAHPHVDEAYRRTFMTGEFGVFPGADDFKGADGLAYPVGKTLNFRDPEQRRNLSRFEWEHNEQPDVTLRGGVGRLYLHVTGEADAAQHSHRISVVLRCHIPLDQAGDVDVSVNGTVVGSADCGKKRVTIDGLVPAGLLGAQTYDTITIRRTIGSLYERIMTRLGFRIQAVELVSLTISPMSP